MKDRFGIDWSKIPHGRNFWKGPHLSRRVFFKHAATAVGGYMVMPGRPMENVAKAAGSPISKAKNCIFILMAGAPAHTDTFDLKEGPWLPSSFNPTSYGGIRWPQGLFPKLGEQLDNIALLRSVKPWAAVHGLSQTWLQIGRNPISGLSKIAPHIGSVVALELGPKSDNRTMPPFVSLNTGIGPGGGYLEPRYSPFYVSPSGGGLGNTAHPGGQAVFDRRYSALSDLDGELRTSGELGSAPNEMATFNADARQLMYNPAVDKIFVFDQTERNRYGNNGFGNACITARNLLRAKMGTRFVQITHGSWDMHTAIYQGNNLNPASATSMGRTFDLALGTLIADLKQDNLLDDTLIVAMGEFGRTVTAPNLTAGRDHFLQQAVLVAGAQIKGPRAIGVTDTDGRGSWETGWSRDRDIRPEDIEATIYSALGIDWQTVRRDDPLGRGFEYVPQSPQDIYGPVHELWA